MNAELAKVLVPAAGVIFAVLIFYFNKWRDARKVTAEFFADFASKDSFLLRAHGFSVFNLPPEEYQNVLSHYLSQATAKPLATDREKLYLELHPGEALALVLNQLRVVKLMALDGLFTPEGIKLFHFQLAYMSPLLKRLLSEMYALYKSDCKLFHYHPWLSDIPWVYQRCGLEIGEFHEIKDSAY